MIWYLLDLHLYMFETSLSVVLGINVIHQACPHIRLRRVDTSSGLYHGYVWRLQAGRLKEEKLRRHYYRRYEEPEVHSFVTAPNTYVRFCLDGPDSS